MADTTAAPAAAPAQAAAPAVDPKAQATTTPKAEATEVIKVNGKEIKVTPAQLRAMAQKGYFADQQLKSVDVLKKHSESLVNALKTPDGVVNIIKEMAKTSGLPTREVFAKMIDAGLIDPDVLGEEAYKRIVKPSKLTPEQIEQEKKLSEYEQLKKEKEAREKQEATTKQQAEIKKVYEAVRAEVSKQIVADKTFPQTEGCIRQVIDKLRVMNKSKAPLTPQLVTKAIEQVKKDHILFQQAILDGDKDQPDYGKRLIARIGKERALAISRALIEELRGEQKAATKEEKKAEKSEGLEESLAKKYGTTKDGRTIMNW